MDWRELSEESIVSESYRLYEQIEMYLNIPNAPKIKIKILETKDGGYMGRVSHYPTTSPKSIQNPSDSATCWNTPEEALFEIFRDLKTNIDTCKKSNVDEEKWVWLKFDNF